MTTTTLNISALSGKLSVGCTVAKNREAGRPPSLREINISFPKLSGKGRLPRESKNHAATGSHNANNGEYQTDERQPETRFRS